MRRFIALTATAALALILVPFAAQAQDAEQQAEETLVVTISNPGTISTSGNVAITANIQVPDLNADSIHWYTVELMPETGNTPLGLFCSKTYPAPGPPPDGPAAVRNVNVSFTWNSKRIPPANGAENCEGGASTVLPSGGSLSTNNKYRIRVTAETFGVPSPEFKDTDVADSGVVSISNAPAAPSSVALSHNKDAKTIKVSWAKNPEPDVSDYRVQECVVDKSSKPCEDNSWKTKADVRGQLLDVKAENPGIYRYRVIALRPTATGATIISEPASAKNDPTEVEVIADPEVTTTTAPTPTDTTPITVTKTVVKPTRRVQRAAPEVVQRIVEEEPGYNTNLPYSGEGTETASSGLGGDSGEGDGQRAILIPLAGGALLLVFAMQVHYLNRRASAGLETVPVDFDEY